MVKRFELDDRLDAIITASHTIVKRLKRLQMRQIVIASFTNIITSAQALKKRNDYLLTTLKRKVYELEIRLEKAINDVADHYNVLLQSVSPALPDLDYNDATKTVRVSMTLQTNDWTIIDGYISAGHAKSYAGFFRLLVNNFLEERINDGHF